VRFGPTPTEAASGGILAHTIELPDGSVLRKGTSLDATHVRALVGAGHTEVVVAILEAGDMGEDEAARTIAAALAGDSVQVRDPSSGRCNLKATRRGIVTLDISTVQAVNRVHESVGVATLPADAPVDPGQLVASVKIMPFGLPHLIVDACVAETVRHTRPALSVSAFRPMSIALLQTTSAVTQMDALDRDKDNVRSRVERLGSVLDRIETCPHELQAITRLLERALSSGHSPVILLGAVASGDRQDVIPQAVTSAGGEVIRFGVPLDPGHLVLIGQRGNQVILGMPGCARSARRNGFDRILEMVLAGRAPNQMDLGGMGVGGLQRL